MMDKASLINGFAKNTEQRVIFAHIFDLALRSENRNTVESGNFLPENDANTVGNMLLSAGIRNFILYGGYEGAERKCPVFLPDYLTEEDIAASPPLAEIVYAVANVDRFDLGRAELSHGDCLGALMGLGIERDTAGDIIVAGGNAVIVIKSRIADYVAENLRGIDRYKVSVTLKKKVEIFRSEKLETFSDTVASMRLDAVIASVFRLSRSAASEAVGRGLVAVNGIISIKGDMVVGKGDKLSLRGKGRVIIESVDGLSKKGRIRFTYKK